MIRICRSLLALLFLSLATATVSAQTFTNLYSFTATPSATNSDGANPYAGLSLSGNTLYGTTHQGGSSDKGTVFRVNTDGTSFTNLHNFTATSEASPFTNSDGTNPFAGVILSDNTLYGTTYHGGSPGKGTVFKVNTDGTGFTNLHSFTATSGLFSTNSDGAHPVAGLFLSGNTLYGTASGGGSSGAGTVFKVDTNGTGFTNLHSFTALDLEYATNSDGANPQAGLLLSGNTLYGTAFEGGRSGNGSVFKINTDGTGFTNLYSFTATPPIYTNSDGANPNAGLILSDNTLYGTAYLGGSSKGGTVFAINTDGTGFTNLHNFAGYPSDGYHPIAGLILSGNTLYGTASGGGSSGYGTVFKVTTAGMGFTNLHMFDFDSGNSGVNPYGGLILSGNTLYGTASQGGSSGAGTVFSLTLPPPQLTIIRSAENIVLSWPTNAAGFTLQSTTNLPSTDWLPVPESPSVVGDQFCVTNSPVGDTLFYRLRGN